MKKITKRLTAAAMAAVMAATVTAVSLTNASATKNPDDTYTQSRGVEAKAYRFAMPGCWQSDYWRQNENCAGIYWWTGADTPGTVYSHDWPGYKMSKVSEAGVDNLYSSPVPADAYMIIINNHIDGGMPGQPNFLQERFDAACNTNDTQSVYYAFMESPYYTKDLWKYVWDKAADEVGRTIDWSDDETRMTSEEATQISNIYDELQEAVEDDDFVLDIPEFGQYAKNFYVEMENGDGIAQSFDNMVYVVNLDPNTNVISTTITPEGKITYGGDWFFYYGNGEYGTWPTKELLAEHTGIIFDDNGNPVLPFGSDMVIDEYGTINRVVTTRDGIQQKLMVAGNFTGKYYSDIPTPDVPSTCSVTTTPYEHPVGGKIYFEVNPDLWKNFNTITLYIYEHNGDALITWGSKKGKMTDEGNYLWSFDFDAKGIELYPSKQYGIIFTADWGVQTCDIIFDTSIIGDTAYCTGNMVENNVDSNKKSCDVRWKNADPEIYAPPVCITAIGNIVGEALWAGTTYYDMLVNFIKSDGPDGLANALKYNGKTAQQTLDDISDRWGLSSDDVERAIREAGKEGNVDWRNPNAPTIPTNNSTDITSGFSFAKLDDGTLMITDCTLQKAYITIPAVARVRVSNYDESVGSQDITEPWFEPTTEPPEQIERYEPTTAVPTTEVPATAAPMTYPQPITSPATYVMATTVPQSSTILPRYRIEELPVSAIGDWAFANNKYVETVEIPDSIKKIGKGAFYNCVKLQSITIPEGVTALSANTFEKCLYLEEVNLGSKLKSIGDEAYYDCRRLRTLDIPASVTEIGEEAFTNCRSLTNLTIPDGVKKLGDENSVGYGMFENCKNLSWITVPASVDYINPDTFDGCGSLTICGEKNSAAQEFASNNNILFRVINEPDCMVGDINGNGTVTIDDATMVQKAVAEMVVLTGTQTLAADADGDGVVNINDATMIQKYIAELVDHLG